MKIIVADDHPLVRAGLAQLLTAMASAVRIIEAADYAGAHAAISANGDADLALIDLRMPGMQGAASIRVLADVAPAMPLVVISASVAPRDIRDALAAGALGFVPKHESPIVLLAALRCVMSGATYVPACLADATEDELAERPNLTPRQNDVMRLLAEGRSNKDIARQLGLTEQTVKGHLLTIYRALNVRNRVEAVQVINRFSDA